ncbi:isoprenoid synthase domain-containing protein [Rhodofomes roseus]|uniref:Isoprenoid synthase domain-containing protein n=1 Tax=Rhodofomes roseus TaxID=34475 RepID=A0ABQ8KNL4_9APHY|nr:isoprenoid synthase domain-containing protein [Rhodofomes roseus]KAH9840017.1 isoprenoid synthase domain-containing protein [Rhodofomes roseus]
MSTVPQTTSTPDIIADKSRRAVRDLLERLQFTAPSFSRDHVLESRVVDVLRGWGRDMFALLRPYVPPAIIMTITGYHHITDIDVKVKIALFSCLITGVDDMSVLGSSVVRDFHHRLCVGSMQYDTGVMGRLMQTLSAMWPFYPEFSATSIFTSVTRVVNGCMLEQISGKPGIVSSSDALPFIAYRRDMSGLGEAFAYFIWDKKNFPDVELYIQAIPDICWFLCYINDILSFYKEELAGETSNYMSDRARASGDSAQETLQKVIDETISIVERVRNILGEGPVRDAWESFAKGYITFHTHNPRYRLKELIECEYIVVDGIDYV